VARRGVAEASAAPGEEGSPVLRAEFLFAGGKAFGLRSSAA